MAVDVSVKHANFIGRSVQAAQQFIQAYNLMVSLRAEWDSLAYSTGIVDSDFSVKGNQGSANGFSYPYLAAADLAAFYTSEGNLVTFWTSGNGTNISRLVQ